MRRGSAAWALLLVFLCLDAHVGAVGVSVGVRIDDDIDAGYDHLTLQRTSVVDKVGDETWVLTADNYTHNEVMSEAMEFVTGFFLLYMIREIWVAYSITQILNCRMDKPPAGFKTEEYQYNLLEQHHGIWPSLSLATRVVIFQDPVTNETRLFPFNKVTNFDYQHSILGIMFHEGNFHAAEEKEMQDGDIIVGTSCNPFTKDHPAYQEIFGSRHGLNDHLESMIGQSWTEAGMDNSQITLDVLKPAKNMHWCPQERRATDADFGVNLRSNSKSTAFLRLEKVANDTGKCFHDGETFSDMQKNLDATLEFKGLEVVLRKMKEQFMGLASSSTPQGTRGNAIGLHKIKSGRMWIFFAFLVVSYLLLAVIPGLYVQRSMAGKKTGLMEYLIPDFVNGANVSDRMLMFRVLYLRIVVLLAVPALFYVGNWLFRKAGVQNKYTKGNRGNGGGFVGAFYIIFIIGAANLLQVMLFYDSQLVETLQQLQTLNIAITSATWINHVLGLIYFANAVGLTLQEYFGSSVVLPPVMSDNAERFTLGTMGLIEAGISFIQSIHENFGHDTFFCDLRTLHHYVATSASVARHPNATLDYSCTAPVACNESDMRARPCPWSELPQQRTRVNLQEGLCRVFCNVENRTQRVESTIACQGDGLRGSMWTWNEINGETICD